MVWLPGGIKILRICSAVLTEYRRVTDRQTDRHILRQRSPRYAYASRGENGDSYRRETYSTYRQWLWNHAVKFTRWQHSGAPGERCCDWQWTLLVLVVYDVKYEGQF